MSQIYDTYKANSITRLLDFTRVLNSEHNKLITQPDITTQDSNLFYHHFPLIALNETFLNLCSKWCNYQWKRRRNILAIYWIFSTLPFRDKLYNWINCIFFIEFLLPLFQTVKFLRHSILFLFNIKVFNFKFYILFHTPIRDQIFPCIKKYTLHQILQPFVSRNNSSAIFSWDLSPVHIYKH